MPRSPDAGPPPRCPPAATCPKKGCCAGGAIPTISLRTRLLALLLAAGVAVAIATLAVFDRSSRAIAHHFATRYAMREALLQRSRVGALVERELALARKLADDPVLLRWAAAEHDPALEAGAAAQLESYRRAFRDKSFFVAVEGSRSYYVYDAAPDQRRVRKTALRPDAPADRWYFELLRRDQPFALNVDVNATLGAVKVWVNVLLRDGAGRVLGVGGTGIDLSDFLEQVRARRDGDAATILVDGRGVIQAHWNRDHVERNARATSDDAKVTIYQLVGPADGDRLRAALARLSAEGPSVDLVELELEGRPYLVAATRMEGLGWYGLVVLDEEGIFSMRQLLPLLLAIALGIGALLVALGLALDRWLLRPVAALEAAARAVGQGDYRVRVPEARKDELGVLARTFNGMTSTILEYTERLQEKVEERTRQLSDAYAALRESHARIEESLRYAQAIQASILPPPELLDRALGPHVVVYLPRDAVGGDFYHLRATEHGAVAAVVDCTGHGVPGAFVSMTASSVLQHVLEDGGEDDPARVLSLLGRGVRQARHHHDVRGALDAGLDVLVCRVDHRTRTLAVAGAGLSAFVVEGGEVLEVKGDRQRVGYHGSDPAHRFTARVLSPASGARVYLVTDGLLDHAGGEKGFGFGTPRLRALLGALAPVPMAEQAELVRQALRDWAGALPQRDDITVLGFEIHWRSAPNG